MKYADTMFAFRCNKEELAKWRKQAEKELGPRKLTQWLISRLNRV